MVKQHLTLANLVEREEFCKSFITDDKSTFHDMLDVIHVDEKWFYMTKNTKKFMWAHKNRNRIVQQEASGLSPR